MGEPPFPRAEFTSCIHGDALRAALVLAAGTDSWEAGYVEAVFDIGEQMHRLFEGRLRGLWQIVEPPPGPWRERI